jgi:hypothetical protein
MHALSTMYSSYSMLGYCRAQRGAGAWVLGGGGGCQGAPKLPGATAAGAAGGTRSCGHGGGRAHLLRHLSAALNEQAVRLLHDVGFVDGRHLQCWVGGGAAVTAGAGVAHSHTARLQLNSRPGTPFERATHFVGPAVRCPQPAAPALQPAPGRQARSPAARACTPPCCARPRPPWRAHGLMRT